MATKIRLRRIGVKKTPFYRIVVADARSPRDGKCIEEIGYYSPIQSNNSLKIKEDRAIYWIGVGAQLSETVKILFKKSGIKKNK